MYVGGWKWCFTKINVVKVFRINYKREYLERGKLVWFTLSSIEGGDENLPEPGTCEQGNEKDTKDVASGATREGNQRACDLSLYHYHSGKDSLLHADFEDKLVWDMRNPPGGNAHRQGHTESVWWRSPGSSPRFRHNAQKWPQVTWVLSLPRQLGMWK